MLDAIDKDAWPVLTLHAEMEGKDYAGPCLRFLRAARQRGVRCIPLRDLLRERHAAGPLPRYPIGHRPVRGRHGVVSVQLGAAPPEAS